MSKNYRIGLDIGIGSVGWAVLEDDVLSEEPTRILDLGVRAFNPNEIQKTGESTAAGRREKRGIRRRKRRRAFRFLCIQKLFNKVFGEKAAGEVNSLINVDVYELRARALDERVGNVELIKIILNLLKRRGFKSNRKSGAGEDGKLLGAVKENQKFLQEHNYRTIGEAIYKDNRFFNIVDDKKYYLVRNHDGDYKNCFYRSVIENELNMILQKQKQYNNLLTEDFIKRVLEIFNKQRNFDEGPGSPSPYKANFEVGQCTFIKTEKRAPKASYTFELFNALSKINSLRIDDEPLSQDDRNMLYELIKEQKSLTYASLRKKLSIPDSSMFNLCRYVRKNKDQSEEEIMLQSEKSTFVSMERSYEIRKSLKLDTSYDNRELIDSVALMLSLCKSDSKRDEYAQKDPLLSKLTRDKLDDVEKLNFDKFGSLSIKAMEKMIPFLLLGQRYDEAAMSAGFNHSSFEGNKKKLLVESELSDVLNDITSPVVKRSVHQTIRIVNEIIKKYGSPQYINIELARELAKNFNDRNKITKKQAQNFAINEDIKKKLEEEFHLPKVSGLDIVKYKLYMEQDGKCMYSGEQFDESRIFEPNYLQIDHILPYSRSMNDSYNNKVLVLASENQNKGDRTPYEYFGSDEEKWNKFVARVGLLKNKEKKTFLLKKNFSEDVQKEYINRNLNDTQYMARFLFNLFKDNLQLSPSKKKKQVRSVNGAVTSYLRKCWGISKVREDGDIHHCIDAAVIACVSDGQIQKITEFNKFKEIFVPHNEMFVNRLTGEVISEEEKNELEKNGIDMLSKRLPLPYPHFVKELKLRTRDNYLNNDYSQEEKMDLVGFGYESNEVAMVKPVFVSRMKTVKKSGAIHEETMMSLREYDETKKLIKTVSIEKLKLGNKPETVMLKDDSHPEVSIEDYYRPQDDRLLYLKLKEYLIEHGSIAPNVEFHKPKRDGTDGPVVKKVKKYVYTTNCVKTPNGGAANDKMFRVDVFRKAGKYYLCPVYMNDVYAHKLPNKVIAINKPWIDIDDTFEFQFSLYQNDLIKIKSKRDIELKKNFNNPNSKKIDSITAKEFLVYYNSTDIKTAAIEIKAYDNCYKLRGLGVQNLLSIEKYYVDIMGKVYKAPKEERKPL